MNDNPIRRAVDTRLSGLAFTPQMQADTLRRARLCNQPPHMRRKLSYSLAFALLALLLAATAGAAAYFGVLRFHAEQESNAAYQQHILPIGERLTGSGPCSEYPGGLYLPARDGHAGWPRHRDPCYRISAAFRG